MRDDLYYTGLLENATLRIWEGNTSTISIDPRSQAEITVSVPAGGMAWYVLE